MNKTYRVVWNAATATWVAASEIAKSMGKSKSQARKLARIAGGAAVLTLAMTGGNAGAYTLDPATVLRPGTAADDGNNKTNIALGDGAVANETGAGGGTAVGFGAKAWLYSTAVGQASSALGQSAVAVGDSASANFGSAIAMGRSASANANYSTAIGDTAVANGAFSIAMGWHAKTAVNPVTGVGTGTIAIGDNASATGEGSVVLGYNASIAADGATAVGYGTNVTGNYASAFGTGAKATAGDATALGGGANAAGGASTAVGRIANATGNASVALGYQATASGAISVAEGVQSTASGDYSTALGYLAQSTAYNSVAIGTKSNAAGNYAVALGRMANTSVDNGVALGAASVASTGPGVAGYVPSGATAAKSAAIGATKGTYGAASVGDAASGVFRQINGVAAGTQDSDAVNVAQLKAAETHYYSVNDNGTKGGNYNNDGATGINALAAGVGATASGRSGVAVGEAAKASNGDTIAMGHNATAASANAAYTDMIAIGLNSNASNDHALAIGTSAAATSNNTTAVGNTATASMSAASAFGHSATASGSYSTALGANANASKGSAVAVGNGSNAAGDNSAAIGYQAATSATNSLAIGNSAKAQTGATNAIAIGSGAVTSTGAVNGVALGNGATASINDGVALGSGSVANTAAGAAGYDPSTGLASTNTNATWKSTLGAVSVGDATSGKTRQIKGLAAGTVDTDAVNVAQLKSVDAKVSLGLNFAGNSGANVHRDLGDTLAIQGTATTAGTYSGNNLKTVTDPATGAVNLQMADNPEFTSVKTGNTTIDNSGLTIAGGPSITTAGIDAGNTKITNVTAGTNATDAVNVSQLTQQSTDLTTKGLNFAGNSGANVHRDLGDTLSIVGAATTAGTYSGNNLKTVTDPATGALNLQMADNPEFTSVKTGNTTIDNSGLTIAGGPSITTAGIDAGNTKITNVTAGTNATDAVNVSQLTQQSTDLTTKGLNFAGNSGANVHRDLGDTLAIQGTATTAGTYSGNNLKTVTDPATGAVNLQMADNPEFTSVKTGNTTIDNSGLTIAGGPSITTAGIDAGNTKITNVTAGTNATDAVNVSQLTQQSTDLTTKGLNFAGNSGANVHRDLGDTLSIVGAATTAGTYSGNNLKTVTDPATGAVNLQMADNPQFTSVKTGNTTIDNSGLTIAGGPSITTSGIDAGGKVISNVAPGVAGTDAVNVDQLNTVDARVTNVDNRVTNLDNRIGDVFGDDSVTNVTTNGVGIRYARTNETGLVKSDSFAQGQGSTAVGYEAKATGDSALALGRNALASADNSVALGANSTTTADLSAAAYNPSTTATIAGTSPVGEVSVGSAGAERRITNLAAGAADTDAVNVSQLKASTSVAVADAVMYDNSTHNSVTLGGDTYNTTTKTGGTRIKNVAAGVDGGDAVNVDQLTTVDNRVTNVDNRVTNIDNRIGDVFGDDSVTNVTKNGVGIRYARTNETGLVKSDSFAQGQGSTAVGYEAKATGDSALALGRNALASADNSVALGANSTTTADLSAAAYNPSTTATIAGTSPVGEVSVGSAGAERRITNLAAGAADTDAVNVSQLKASTSAAVADAVMYDNSTHNSVTLGGDTYNTTTKTGGTRIKNVAAGVDGGDAVNVDQLTTVDNRVTNVDNRVTNLDNRVGDVFGDDSVTNVTTNGVGIRYARTNETGLVKSDSFAQGQGSTAVGYEAKATGDSALALGRNALASADNSVALGANSTTTADLSAAPYNPSTTATIAGTSPVGEVSMGSAGAERRITNLAAGAADTDAVNVSQLKASTSAAVADAVMYDNSTHNSVTLGGDTYNSVTKTGGTVIHNVAAGTSGGDAVNVDQLNQQGSNLTSKGLNFAGNSGANVHRDLGDTLAIQGTATTAGTYSGNNLKTVTDPATGAVNLQMADNPEFTSVKTGNTTIDNSGLTIAGGPSITTAGIDAGNTKITNVTAGTNATDAVNVSQLTQQSTDLTSKGLNFTGNTGGSVHRDLGDTLSIAGAATTAGTYSGNNLKTVTDPATGAINLQMADAPKFGNVTINDNGSGKITGVTAGTAATDAVNVSQLQGVSDQSVKYDLDPVTGQVNYNSVTLGGDTYNSVTKTGGTKITNVARGVGDSDAVNMSQLNETNQAVTNLGDTVNNFAGDQSTTYTEQNGRGIRYVRTNDTNLPQSDAFAQGEGSTAAGYNAKATADQALALGNGAQATFAGSVALGAGSVANGSTLGNQAYLVGGTATGEVNIGNRRITGVSAGAENTDAVNVAQLKAVDGKVDNLDAGAVKYDTNANGTVNYNSVTLGGDTYNSVPKTGGTVIHNVAAGTSGGDAVNVDQLNQQGSNLTSKGLNFAGNSGANVHRDLGDTLAIQGAATTAGTYSGNNLKTVTDPTTGAINLQMADAPKFGNVTINDNGSGKITGVTAGTAATDAVNVSQLQGVSDQSVKYDVDPATGQVNYNSVTLGGDTYNSVTKTGGTKITNVARGVGDSDAVNMSQLNETNQAVTTIGDTVNNFAGDQSTTYTEQNGRGIRYVRTNDTNLPQSDAFAQGEGSTAVGYNATATGAQALALGNGAQATAAGSVALGAGSMANGSTLGNQAYLVGGSATGEVNIGNRRITGVSAGAENTDAVNVAQLKAVDGKVNNLDAAAVKYDKNVDGTVNYNSVTLGGDTYNSVTKTGGTKITNVARGVGDSDAVNMSQLNETNQSITNVNNTITDIAGDTSETYINNNGRGVKYVRTNDKDLTPDDAHASGQGATAVGYNAQASGDKALALGFQAQATAPNSVALGAGSIANGSTLGNAAYLVGGSAAGEVSVGSAGNERRITNVAAGAKDTDAVNVAQLKAVDTKVANIDSGAVKYDKNPDGSPNYNSVTMGGDTYNSTTKGGGTTITNVAYGVNDSDAVNVQQLKEMTQSINDTTINKMDAATRYFQANGTNTDADKAVASGTGSTAMGPKATASGTNSVAVGNGAKATGDGSVAIGANSVADRANTISVGSAGNERQVTNVADGTEPTDAVNVRQLRDGNAQTLNQANAYTDSRIGSVRNDANAGTASAMAMAGLPQAVIPGKGMVGMAGSTYGGQSAVALGVSALSDSGRWVYKASASTNTRGNYGVTVGAGFHW